MSEFIVNSVISSMVKPLVLETLAKVDENEFYGCLIANTEMWDHLSEEHRTEITNMLDIRIFGRKINLQPYIKQYKSKVNGKVILKWLKEEKDSVMKKEEMSDKQERLISLYSLLKNTPKESDIESRMDWQIESFAKHLVEEK